MKALVIGGSSVDTLIHTHEIHELKDDMSLWAKNVVEAIGGTGAGKALCLDVIGNEVTLLTNLGKDDYRDKIIDFFKKTTVDLKVLETDKTTAHTNIMHGHGKRISVFTSTPSYKPALPKNIDVLIKNTDVVFLNINDYCREYIPMLVESGKPIIVDIHDYDPPNQYHSDFIEAATIIVGSNIHIPNEKKFLSEMISKGKEIAILTRGNKGLIAMDKFENVYELKGYTDFEYIDSNGAGDSFCSGFVTEYFKNRNIGESLKIGTLCGAMACTTYDLYNKKFTYKKIKDIKKIVDL